MRIAVPLLVLLLALAGCTGPDTTVTLDAETVTVTVGETLRVDLGEVNDSVGDNWFLVDGADTGVLADAGSETEGDTSCEGDGCGGILYWDFEATAAGATTLQFQYCFRTGLDDCVGDADGNPPADPVALAVTVTD
ncbi:hypothetical protein GCM10009853_091690 [Glycomyces scopariae]|uniref:Chagasin family peptidase inhibitor I42 n=1 Tax=Glycomyces sambucus TaxID=380244 RepID=A0A1G9FHA7_9ACTN|nr:protease inhibitor I42 family protein [Glycomyces sambucus]SDK87727.1 Chagasin family peptidase inhibitor I42 [Glycomyces sambucus]